MSFYYRMIMMLFVKSMLYIRTFLLPVVLKISNMIKQMYSTMISLSITYTIKEMIIEITLL